jgi:RNase P subunit RPR2
MAEFCKECFKKILLTEKERKKMKDNQILMSEDTTICEGCGAEKEYVVRIKK